MFDVTQLPTILKVQDFSHILSRKQLCEVYLIVKYSRSLYYLTFLGGREKQLGRIIDNEKAKNNNRF